MVRFSNREKRYFKEVLIKFWPKILFKNKREKVKGELFKITVKERKEEGLSRGGVRPWAFIRVKNERKMLASSLASILPAIDKGIIAYNECTDGSEEIILDFCSKHKGFIPFNYPYYVEPPGSRKYATCKLREENTLAGYYNAVLNLIPKGDWLVKIDVDQIYFPLILKHSFTLPRNENEVVVYSRINSIRDKDGNIKVLSYVRPGDHWLICNNGLSFVNVFGKGESGDYFAYEHLSLDGRTVLYKPECSSVHFPFEKESRTFKGDVDSLIDFDDFIIKSDRNEISEELMNVKDIILDL